MLIIEYDSVSQSVFFRPSFYILYRLLTCLLSGPVDIDVVLTLESILAIERINISDFQREGFVRGEKSDRRHNFFVF